MNKLVVKKGASGCLVYIEEGVVRKVGPIDVLRAEKAAYDSLKRLLGRQYPLFYPEILSFEVGSDKGTLVVENLGGSSLEEVILELGVTKDKALLDWINRRIGIILATLWRIFDLTSFADEMVAEDFFTEVGTHLVGSLAEAEIDGLAWEEITTRREIFQKPMILSACHRDLNSNNVVAVGQEHVKFFDPKAKLSRASSETVNPGIGCLARDLAMLLVNLRRRERELTRNHDFKGLAVNLVEEALVSLPGRGICSQAFVTLNLAAVYATFTACRCDFCLSPERVWLFEEMEKESSTLTAEVRKYLE